MYLKKLYLQDFGPFKQLEITPEFHDNGRPKPIVLVGSNGTGKTTALAPIVDALMECASVHHIDTLPQIGGNRNWFHTVGGGSTRIGANGYICVADFVQDSDNFQYVQKAGEFILEGSRAELLLSATAKSKLKNQQKFFEIKPERAKEIFDTQQHAFFPSSRWESPHWMNKKSTVGAAFSMKKRFVNNLNKPIFVESALDDLSSWLVIPPFLTGSSCRITRLVSVS